MAPFTIIEINEEEDIRKERKITLHKKLMADEIDAHTSKYVEAGEIQSPRQGNAISSDTRETLDGSIIEQMMQYRDAKLRNIFEPFLQEEEILEVDDTISEEETTFVYNLSLPEEFNDALLRPLGMLMHKYIVWGCLFDWYAKLGLAQARTYGAQLEDIEDEIESYISLPGYAKRPLQPFGPAEKI